MSATDTEGLFVARNVEMPDGGFKIRANNDWVEHGNYGVPSVGDLAVDHFYSLTWGLMSADMNLAAGTYDIWFDLYNAMVYVMTPGKDISEAVFADTTNPEPEPDPELPSTEGWGLVGAFNSWGDSPDIKLVSDGTYHVATGVSVEGEFKLRRDSDWAVNLGAAAEVAVELTPNAETTLVLDGANLTIASGVYDIYLDEATGKVWFINDGSYPSVGETPEFEPTASIWGVVGVVNNWGGSEDIVMYTTETFKLFVARNVVMPDGGFKIRGNNTWSDAENFGLATAGPVEVDHVYELVSGGASGDMTLAAGTYDIWFDLANAKVYVMTPGKDITEAVPGGSVTPDPEPGVEPTASIWGVVGVVNNWGGSEDIVMYTTETFKLFVARNVVMPDGGFKIRGNNTWSDAENFGLATAGPVEVDHVYELVSGGASGDMTLAAGTYDIWFDLANAKVYVMTPGKDISEAVGGDVVVPDPSAQPWYLVGDFNVWKPADANYQMTKEGSWYVYRNFSANGNGVKFVADASWSVNRGGVFVQAGAAISLNQGGADMYVAAGTYDVYLSADASVAYFMPPGSVPATR